MLSRGACYIIVALVSGTVDSGFIAISNETGSCEPLKREQAPFLQISLITARCTVSHLQVQSAFLNATNAKALYITGGIATTKTLPKKPNLLLLSITGNRLGYLPQESFSAFPNLRSLYLTNNSVHQLNSAAFNHLNQLECLDLSENEIKSFSQTLETFPKLKSMNLSHNRIAIMSSLTLVSSTVSILDLSYNRLELIPESFFSGLTQLKRLLLHHNHIKAMELNFYHFDSPLDYLDVSQNPVNVLSSEAFYGFRVRIIVVTHCPNLALIKSYSFKNLTATESIYITDNRRLQYLDTNSFSYIPNLEQLNLENNQLRTLSPHVFNPVRGYLPMLNIGGNQLLCHCTLKWLLEHQSRLTSFEKLSCIESESLLRHHLLTMDQHSGECEPEIVNFKPTTTVDEGTVKLPCIAFGVPEPSISWVIPSSPPELFNNLDYYVSADKELITRTATEPFNEVFQCVASNELGHRTLSYETFSSKDSPDIVILATSGHSVKFTWTRPKRYETNHNVTVKDLEDSTLRIIRTSPLMKSYTLHNLKPSTTYRICVSSVLSSTKLQTINCNIVTTAEASGNSIVNYGTYGLTVAVTVCVAFGALTVCICLVVRHRNKAKMMREHESRHNLMAMSSNVSSRSVSIKSLRSWSMHFDQQLAEVEREHRREERRARRVLGLPLPRSHSDPNLTHLL